MQNFDWKQSFDLFSTCDINDLGHKKTNGKVGTS